MIPANGGKIAVWNQPVEVREMSKDGRWTPEEIAARFPGEDVPLPHHWGGYRIEPETIEFWKGREHRLHDRFRFTRDGAAWRLDRLWP